MEHAGRSRAPAIAAVALAGASLTVVAAGAADGSFVLMTAAVALVAAGAITFFPVLPWRILVGALVVVITFIPIRRYTFGTGLPVQLEPYRVLVALLLFGWGAALLVDPRTHLRRTGLEAPIALVGAAALLSIVGNLPRVGPMQSDVLKSVSYLASFVLVFFLVAIVSRTARDVDTVLKTLVTSMAIVGALAVIERRTGWSPFMSLNRVLPLVSASAGDVLAADFRGTGIRARGPAEHPIALGAVLVLVVPISLYLATTAKTWKIWWWGAAGMLAIGALATLSRTGIVMLTVVGLVFLWLRTRETVRLWPLLLPFLAVVHIALPGTLGSFKAGLFPEGGVVATQDVAPGEYSCRSSGRVADLGPALDQLAPSPLVGIGFGTRVISDDVENSACILDNQWLGTLLETGILGVLAWVWLFTRLIRRLGRGARSRDRDGQLCAALAASVGAFAVSMFTYDAFSFVQVTFVLFLLAGLGGATLTRMRRVNEMRGATEAAETARLKTVPA